ncbi:hypothetical protein E2A64_07120 [Pseudohoeflea suaedae]|uniref:Uncharacterized protein n=1 Tax=Pseudohoeflea suaedae TaxID=877384 RepID=A0A4R5PPK2_9HYPH|nr:hypothetical protein [Pseudohoeflea suaedae]TDH38858.1 hypothetical protein E2A64_07120 [Pseudohoeflea suaedae]
MQLDLLTKTTLALAALLSLTAPSSATDCSRAVARVVSETGGELLSATPQNRGGRNVCVVTVLVPGHGDERPKKLTLTVRS